MAEVTRKKEVQAPAAVVWSTVGDFAGIGRFSHYITTCEIEGERGVGQIRRLTTSDGSLTVSRCTALDDDARSVSYQILETTLPLTDYSSTQTVREIDGARCAITWTSHFEPNGISEAEARGLLEERLDASLAELARIHERQ